MKTVILSSDTPTESIEHLSVLGYEVITLPKYGALPSAIASHPDTLIFKGEDRLIVDKAYYLENEELFRRIAERAGRTVVLSGDALGDKYPYDTRLNAILIGTRLFCRLDSISGTIVEYARERGLDLINTRQGYPACSTLKIAENAVICADRGLSALYKKHGISVYGIEAGGISLPPYEYGFIGGASVKLDNFVCFFGDVSMHPSYEIIKRALFDHSLLPVCLGKHAPTDLGGGILL